MFQFLTCLCAWTSWTNVDWFIWELINDKFNVDLCTYRFIVGEKCFGTEARIQSILEFRQGIDVSLKYNVSSDILLRMRLEFEYFIHRRLDCLKVNVVCIYLDWFILNSHLIGAQIFQEGQL